MIRKVLKIAVVGCGYWGPNHIRTFSRLPGVQVAAAVDRDPVRLRSMLELVPSLWLSQEPIEVLNSRDIDAVVLATPTATHYELARRSLLAGKHVLCEKPLCLRADEARELNAIARERELVLMVGYTFLFNAGIAKLRTLIANGELGDLFHLSAVRTNLGPIRNDVNAVYDLATHDVSIFNWLLDAVPTRVLAAGGAFIRKDIEDVATVCLEYPKGIFGTIHVSWLNPRKVRQISVVGARRMATWDDLELSTPIAIYDRGAAVTPDVREYGEFLRVDTWDGDVRLPKLNLEEPLKLQARFFVEGALKGRVERANGDFSVGVMATVEAAVASLRAGRRIDIDAGLTR